MTAPARRSATLVLVREGADAHVEVLLVRRADRGDQNSSAWVFPGGLIEDTDDALHALFHDSDDAAASARVGVPARGLDVWAAALRETFEEAGLLLAEDGDGRVLAAGALHALPVQRWRDDCASLPRGQGGAAFAALCSEQGWRLSARALHPIAHWITPHGMPKRFDTHFLLGVAPPGQAVVVDGIEIVDHCWLRPSQVLQRADREMPMGGPARAVLQDLAAHASVSALLAWAAALGVPPTIRPRLARDHAGRLAPVHPSHAAHAEIGRIDPQGEGRAYSVIRAGAPVALSDRVLRLTANNGSVMTGPGTNTYLLRAAGDDRVLIDPGPDDAAHVQATLACLDGLGARLTAILVTHTHSDHSPAAQALHAATGAPLYGRVADFPQWQDARFQPQHPLAGGETLDFGGGLALQVIHTPGHASNHLCYLHDRMLFTGDHVMQGSTVVINPPDGDMAAYLASLAALAEDDRFDVIAPGHGFLIEQPQRLLRALIRHRQLREAKVQAALQAVGPATIDELVLRVYDDVGPERHAIAKRSLLAHLLHLQAQGRAGRNEARWSIG